MNKDGDYLYMKNKEKEYFNLRGYFMKFYKNFTIIYHKEIFGKNVWLTNLIYNTLNELSFF